MIYSTDDEESGGRDAKNSYGGNENVETLLKEFETLPTPKEKSHFSPFEKKLILKLIEEKTFLTKVTGIKFRKYPSKKRLTFRRLEVRQPQLAAT